MSERNLLEQLYFKTEEAVQLPVMFGFLAFLIKHIGLPRGKSFWAKFESTSCRGAVLQATDLLYPPRLPMLFASRAVCKFSSLILKILAWIRYHQLYPPYSIHLPWYNHLVFFWGGGDFYDKFLHTNYYQGEVSERQTTILLYRYLHTIPNKVR